MGSALLSNDRVGFVVTKPFTSREKTYAVGDDFDQDEARNIEVLVRARYVVPVVDDLEDRPKYWYKEVKLKSALLEKLNRSRVQIRMHNEPDSDEVVNVTQLTHPQAEPDEEVTPVNAKEKTVAAESVHSGLYDPSYHSPSEVNEHLATERDPEERERVLEAERNGKARKGILKP
jgi:hypothetical protein